MNSTVENFVIPEMGVTMGNLLCSYLILDTRVHNAGYHIDHNNRLVVRVCIKDKIDVTPETCICDAIKKSLDEINQLKNSWNKQLDKTV